MNTLRILKGRDISLLIDNTELCFVKEFCAKEMCDYYKIEEILNDNEVDYLKRNTGYVLTIVALSHLDSSVFSKDNFTLSVSDGENTYDYVRCKLKEKVRDIEPSKEILDKYTIIASDLKILEGVYE